MSTENDSTEGARANAGASGGASGFTHLDEQGKARMVDVSAKPKVRRTAIASGRITMAPDTLRAIQESTVAKGDVLAVARVAGILGAKKTHELIPLCHAIEIDSVQVDFTLAERSVEITATAICTDKTGIEMEALTAVSTAALTIYDMCKALDKAMTIEDISLVDKQKEALQ
jgi:cyclic pyranopterin phosphate synthase